ncbi:hypothetical protein M0R45_021734 [Rubus argutus]|uniref:Rx N-terminal domain-containing protein n=1 Tax=Rubus argutus TaxID=59490 RepID=A0AAW1XDI7_RUBAR
MAGIASLVLSTGITSAILQVVVERVTKFVELKKDLFTGVNDNLRKLKRTLMKIQARVDDVEKRQSFLEAAEDFLEDLKSSFLDAEDLLDKIGLGLERMDSVDPNQVRDYLVPFWSSIPSEVKKMQEKLDELVRELETYSTIQLKEPRVLASSLVDESSVFGRDKDMCKIKKLVLSVQEEVGNVSVIPIVEIYGLETLKLKSCPKLLHLPENLKDLIKLRHLDFDRHRQLSSMPIDVGKLTSLETLHAFRVGKEKGYQIEELKNMRCLRGSISITNLENVADFLQAEAAMLHNKQYLDRLELEWNGMRDQMQPVQQEVLTGLEPHVGLKELRVTGYCGSFFPKWIAESSFSKLESIELENCPFCVLLPSLGQLPALKKLLVQNMCNLEGMDRLFCGPSAGFLSLETLTLRDMPELSNWSGLHDNDMPCLRELSIDSCPKLATLPSFHYLTSLQYLDINRCPQLQSLPEGGLPPSLKTLTILESDILKDRCKVGDGADWNKIRWIPNILIENMVIPVQRPDNQVDDVQCAPENMFFSRNSWMNCSVILFPLFVLFMRSLYQYLSQARD